jgi:hypothetical protein
VAEGHLAEDRKFAPGELEGLAGVLDSTLEASERIRSEGEEAVASPLDDSETYGEAASLLLAAAGVDAMLAADLAKLDPELKPEQPAEDEEDEGLGDERLVLLGEADLLFGGETGIGGAAPLIPNRQRLIGDVNRAGQDLVSIAEGPSADLLRGLVVVAGGGLFEFLPAAEHTGLRDMFHESMHGLLSRAPRFLAAHLAKLVGLRAEETLVDEIGEEVKANGLFGRILTRVADLPEAERRNGRRIGTASLVPARVGELEAALFSLDQAYRVQGTWLTRAARWLRRGSSLFAHFIAPPVGHIASCSVFLVGLGYLGYSLTDRIDARNLGPADRVVGIVPLVSRYA